MTDSYPAAVATGLPNRYYSNREDFLAEREKIFAPMWTCIGFASNAPNSGDVFPIEFMELPLLLVRGSDQVLRVFHNVCRHRGHVLISAPGTVKQSLRCPYHSWTYTLEGKLVRTPNIGGVGINEVESLDRSKFGLIEVASEQWHDLVFINLSGDAPPFAEFISPLAQRWEPYWGNEGSSLLHLGESHSRIELELQANWKLVVENYLEAYHLPTVHPALNKVSPLVDHEIYLAEDFAGQLSHCYTLGAGADGHLPVFPAWPKDAYQEAEYPALFPNTLLGLQADHLFVMVVIPLAYNRTLEETRLYCVGDQSLSSRFTQLRKAQHTFWREVFAEDIDVVMGMQAGRASPGFDGGALTPVMDRATAAFHRWVGERLGSR